MTIPANIQGEFLIRHGIRPILKPALIRHSIAGSTGLHYCRSDDYQSYLCRSEAQGGKRIPPTSRSGDPFQCGVCADELPVILQKRAENPHSLLDTPKPAKGANMNNDSKCPKCGTPLEPPGDSGGRPRRWCSPGCQRSGEEQMRRLHLVMKRLELDKAWAERHTAQPWRECEIERIDELIAERQQQYDRLAGVPGAGEDDKRRDGAPDGRKMVDQ